MGEIEECKCRVSFCAGCAYLQLTEEEQRRQGRVIGIHWCLKYNKQVRHLSLHPHLPRLPECVEESGYEAKVTPQEITRLRAENKLLWEALDRRTIGYDQRGDGGWWAVCRVCGSRAMSKEGIEHLPHCLYSTILDMGREKD